MDKCTFSFQVTPVFINQQNGTQITQTISLDLLKAHGTPTLVTDSNGNHYLIALTSHTTDGQNGVSSVAKTNGRITLQVRWNLIYKVTRFGVMFRGHTLISDVLVFFRGCSRLRVNCPALTANRKNRKRPSL